MDPRTLPPPPTGIVLAGAAALGAYEAGVLQHVVEAVAPEVGRAVPFDIVSGTSAGALNAVGLAAFADRPVEGVARLCDAWRSLRLGRVLRPSTIELLLLVLEAGGISDRLPRALQVRRSRGGLLDNSHIAALLAHELPVEQLHAHVRAGRLRGVAITATHVATGRSTVFYETSVAGRPWAGHGGIEAVPTRLGIEHALASAAIPMLFPPVVIDGDLYCDGGLRQMVPLSPSLQLGARRLLVINPLARPDEQDQVQQERREAVTSPFYLAGKALNSLFADRTELDVERLDQITTVLRAGRKRYGPSFDAEINAELAREGAPELHEVTAVRIDPACDLGAIAVEFANSEAFARRERGIVARVVRHIAERGPVRAGDLLSYLLFDGDFADALIARGRADARAHHAELCALLAPAASAAEAPAEVA